jgi:hypothetical protein
VATARQGATSTDKTAARCSLFIPRGKEANRVCGGSCLPGRRLRSEAEIEFLNVQLEIFGYVSDLLCIFLGFVASGGASGCSTNGLSCKLGGDCTPSQICPGGIEGCTSNCQCFRGIWQTPCPTEVPQDASACSADGVTCGYVTTNTACSGSVSCSCQMAVWSCGPTCVVIDASSQEEQETSISDAGLSCGLGGMCLPAQVCPGGVVGCVSNCQCLDGMWQTPCPAGAPQNGSTCAILGAQCGYLTDAIACSGSVGCACLTTGVWSCGPTCVILDAVAPEQ